LSLVLVLFVATALRSMDLVLGAFGGAVIGAGLGVLGLRLTRFEITPDGKEYYTPNAYIGAALISVVVGRLIYRFTTVAPMISQSAPQADPFATVHSSPLTLGVLTVMIGYYLAYFIGILREGKKHGVA
jgi:cytochrome b561